MLSARTKTKMGATAVKRVAKNPSLLKVVPPATRAGWKFAKPLAKRRARKRVEHIGDTARAVAMSVATYGPEAARVVGYLTPPPKRGRLIPRIGVGVMLGTGAVLGGAAVYFLEPKGGREHRSQIRKLVS